MEHLRETKSMYSIRDINENGVHILNLAEHVHMMSFDEFVSFIE